MLYWSLAHTLIKWTVSFQCKGMICGNSVIGDCTVGQYADDVHSHLADLIGKPGTCLAVGLDFNDITIKQFVGFRVS